MSNTVAAPLQPKTLRAGMIGMGMIFDDTYRPFFERVHAEGLYDKRFGPVAVPLVAVASRTGSRADKYRQSAGDRIARFESFTGEDSVAKLLASGVNFACVATPDDRHFDAARQILAFAAFNSGLRATRSWYTASQFRCSG